VINNTNHNDTIIAPSTPIGTSALSIIRLSGKNSIILTNKIFKSKNLLKVDSHTLHYGRIVFENEVIDEVVISIFKAPKSFTKENVVEISCHGSPFIIEKIISIFLNLGAKMAKHGEFTLRAFLNGNIDLSQAEAVADLISSNSKNSHKIAISHIKGNFSKKINELREELINFSSLIELELDFSEEDVEFANRKKLLITINKIIDFSNHLIDSYDSNNVLKNGVEIVIAGKPNVGKSTILNTLIDEDKAIVSSIPGTTRDIIEDTINIGGNIVRFIDTAGIRRATNKIEKIGINKAIKRAKNASIILYIFDLYQETIESIKNQISSKLLKDKNVILIGNKSDLKIKDNILNFFNKNELRIISSKKSNDIKALLDVIDNNIKRNIFKPESSISVNQRHYSSLIKVNKSIENVKRNLEEKSNTDLIALDIKYSLSYLGEITGEITNDDVLSNIFSKFCIGK
jgi:tRNA modification GTPase